MGRFPRRMSPRGAMGAAGVMWLLVVVSVGATAAASRPQQSPQSPLAPVTTSVTPAKEVTAAAAPSSGYVGDDICLTCHEDKSKGYQGTPHARVKDPRSPAAAKGCESCHGPGQAHVDAGGDGQIKNPKNLQPQEISEICSTCHNRSEHNQWDGSKHDSRNMSCATCHSVHEAKSEKARLKTDTITETCVQCHRKEVNKVHKASHMPVREGKMECTTCHNPHGSQNVKLLRDGNSINEACATCHAEKRGPFLWEHAVGRENCTTCHDPHGSNNERMLVAKLPMLCQKCHVHSRHPATIYDNTQVNVARSNRVVGRACVNCHQMIHGSNHPTSGKVFIR
jgi:DmsE family decaheme c-type cytochrome